MDYMATLAALTAAAGTSGNEDNVAGVVEGLFRQYTGDVWRDPLGNVYARVGSGRPVVLVCAHMDEIGMRVAAIEENGMLRMARVGGVDPRVLPGSEVVVHGVRDLPGVIGAVPPHLLGADRDAAYAIEDLLCDVGYPPESVRELVNVGDTITFAPLPPLALQNGAVACKTMDDRALVMLHVRRARDAVAARAALYGRLLRHRAGGSRLLWRRRCGASRRPGHRHRDGREPRPPRLTPPTYRTTPLDKVCMTRGGNIHPGVFAMLSPGGQGRQHPVCAHGRPRRDGHGRARAAAATGRHPHRPDRAAAQVHAHECRSRQPGHAAQLRQNIDRMLCRNRRRMGGRAMLERLKTLSELYGVSGNETRVRAYLRKQAEPYADDITVDPIGNLYVHKCGEGPRVMLAAHMDEVGMIVRDITESGTLLYDAGGIDPRVVVSKRVAIGPERRARRERRQSHPPASRPEERKTRAQSTPTCMWTSAQRTEPTLKSSLAAATISALRQSSSHLWGRARARQGAR